MPPSHEFPVLALQEVVKGFPGVLALKGVSMEVRRGEVHALVGGNGAGKSTLVKVAAGALAPDSGEVWVHGERLQPNPRAAQTLGIRLLYQERQIAPDLTVGENVLLDGVPVNRTGGIGHNLPQETPREFVAAVLDAIKLSRTGTRI
jgi:ABC-type sugar transport system ATPase subunit